MKIYSKKITCFIIAIGMMILFLSSFSFAEELKADQYINTVNTITADVKAVGIGLIITSSLATAIMYFLIPMNVSMKDYAKKSLYGVIAGTVVLLLASEIAGMLTGFLGDIAQKEGRNIQIFKTPKTGTW